MKTSVKKDTHTGTQPIRVLKHNLLKRLVERNENLINNLQSDFRLAKNIKYHIVELPLTNRQTPYIDNNGLINLHETYLSYIWTISFSMFVIYEERIAIPDQLRQNNPQHKTQNLEIAKLAEELFDYSKSLVKVYTEWDKDYFPNPEYFDEETDEGWYILRTNDLFVEVINFVLFHEIAHAELKHINKVTKEKLSDDKIKDLELEADTRAVNLMIESCRNLKITELAIIIGLASMLFCNKYLDGGRKHPNIDVRIANAINIINPQDDSSLWPFLVLFIKLWDKQFEHNFTHKNEYRTYKDFFYELIKQAK